MDEETCWQAFRQGFDICRARAPWCNAVHGEIPRWMLSPIGSVANDSSLCGWGIQVARYRF
jgi:hypothetical protein